MTNYLRRSLEPRILGASERRTETRIGRALPSFLLLSICLAAVGCAGSEEPPPERRGGESSGERSVEEAADQVEQEAEQTDAQFKQSPFGSVVDELPIGRPPLPVRQYIVDDGESGLIARLPAREFFCGKGLGERREAVASFYSDARERFRRKGIDDVELVVAPLTESLDEVEPLARARRGRTTLTRRGRAEGKC